MMCVPVNPTMELSFLVAGGKARTCPRSFASSASDSGCKCRFRFLSECKHRVLAPINKYPPQV